MGSVIYKSVRIGQYGKPFFCYKFRTMVEGADKKGGPSTAEDDPRITKVGRILRKTKLDELPQLWNVLKGEMSLVGPRPTVPEVIETLSSEEKKIILSVKPGMTGLGSLYDSDEEERLKGSENPHRKFLEDIYPEIVARELWYITHQSLWLDIKILWWTILKLLFRHDIKFSK